MNNYANTQSSSFNLKANYGPDPVKDALDKRRKLHADKQLAPVDQLNNKPRILDEEDKSSL